jgi:hypothetical protein
MTTVSYPANSPYSATSQTSWYLGRMVWRAIPPDTGDTLYTLLARHNNRPDTLSYDLYGTPAYYWTFCVRNPFLRIDPIWAFTTGTQIWVPSNQYLRKIVG